MSRAGCGAGQDSALMGLEETASYLGLSEAQVCELVRLGELYPVKPGPLFHLEILAAWKCANLMRIETPPER